MIFRRFLRRFLSTTSNAAVKSKDARAAKPPLSQAFESFVSISMQAVSVLKFLLNHADNFQLGQLFLFLEFLETDEAEVFCKL